MGQDGTVASRFHPIISPDVPGKAHRVIARAEQRRYHLRVPIAEAAPWHPAAVLAVVPPVSAASGAIIGFLLQVADSAPGTLFGWSVGFGAAGLAAGLGISGVLVRRWRLQRLERRWAGYVVDGERQSAAAATAPGVGERLARLSGLIGHIGASRAYREGWLPGIDAATLGRLHFALADELLSTADLRAAVAAAGDRAMFAEQVAARREQLADFDADFDAQLEHLASIATTADAIVQRLDDLELAERLGSGAPAASQLRRQFACAIPTDLPAMAEAAREAARLVHGAIDPQRLYPA